MASQVGRCRQICKIFNMHLSLEFYFVGSHFILENVPT